MAKKIAKEYYLMHKDIPVCLMELTEGGTLGNYRKNEAALAHFPIGGQMNDMKFHDWWKDRAIPKTRHGAKTALQRLGYSSTNSALVDNLALSLSDCYWIKPRGEDIEWKDVNLFTNDFVDTFGEITLNKDNLLDLRKKTKFNCAASQGELQKKWCIDTSGRRYMIKGNYGESYQQSINELFATELHRKQKFENFTVYTPTLLTVEGGIEGLGCLSYDFCSENLECISAWELLQSVKLKQNESYYYPLKKVCLGLGIKEEEFDYFMDYEIMTDYLISNTDRHMNNISIVRNPDTLEILGFAPIYDSGFCVWTSGTVFTLVVFFLTSILVSLYVFSIPKIKVFPVWTTHDSVFTNWKIYRSEWIFTILPVSSLFLEHGEFHILFHSMLFTKDVIVVRTISGICHWILRIKAICSIKLVHQRNKTIHV